MNQITVNFIECEPAPANGYIVIWRLVGSAGGYTSAGNFTSSPAVFTDSDNPDGSDYEGFIYSDCSESAASGESGDGNFGSPVAWTTFTEEPVVCRNYHVSNITSETDTFAYISCDGVTTPVLVPAFSGVDVCAREGFVYISASFTSTEGAIC
jgi:hypothetical protein